MKLTVRVTRVSSYSVEKAEWDRLGLEALEAVEPFDVETVAHEVADDAGKVLEQGSI